MIRSFKNRLAEDIYNRRRVKWANAALQQKALLRLIQLDQSRVIDDMRLPPGNRLETLKGNRKNQWSIRINDQWRICFVWEDRDAFDVEIVDYH